MRIIFFAVIAGFCLPAFAAGKLPRVPPGFTIEKVTTSKLVKHPMMAGFDDRGRLFVACSAGKNVKAADLMKDPPNFIKMLEDTDGDGIFDKATVFADKMTLPMGALWYRGALYVASPPHIWKLEDTNNDGIADKRRILVNKFGFSGNAASVHGCFLGPCGRIYWCDGRHGHEFVDKKGKVVSKGKAARIFSCKPDGSDVRVHCGGGMDNPVEIDFTETGEMIGSVNILLSKPRGDCLMHWVEGGVYPRLDQQQCIAEFKSTGDPLPPMKNLGHVAVSGMMRYRSNQFGKKFQNNIFTTLFNTHKVIRSELKRSGATFTTTEHEFLTSNNPDFHPTDVLEDADGSLLVIDTGGWFRIGCPVSKVAKPNIHGAIYRIRRKGAHKIADPRGLKLGFSKMPAKQAVKYLDDPRRAVREKAIDRLFRIGERPSPTQLNPALSALRSVIRSSNSTVAARRNAVWAL
ncbi:MAG: PVC-type heme-binding CxxCH protein, partial [Planctomycetaceae bacterium]